ncbi:MAG: hypothetical protein WCD18_19500, partial [Thermosynechococcaceae cyanobacterium]
ATITALASLLLVTSPSMASSNSSKAKGSLVPEVSQKVKLQKVINLTPNAPGIKGGIVGHKAFIYKHDWGLRNGQWRLTLNWDLIQPSSHVHVAVSECDASGNSFVAGAKFTVHNIAPITNGVTILTNIEWNEPIRLCADYFIVNPTL